MNFSSSAWVTNDCCVLNNTNTILLCIVCLIMFSLMRFCLPLYGLIFMGTDLHGCILVAHLCRVYLLVASFSYNGLCECCVRGTITYHWIYRILFLIWQNLIPCVLLVDRRKREFCLRWYIFFLKRTVGEWWRRQLF